MFVTGTVAFAASQSHVTVKCNPVRITRQEFDPMNPPSSMPPLTPDEAGVTHFEFTCDAGIGVFIEPKNATTVEVRVDAVDMILDLPIDIWVRKGARAKVYQHEEGHRKICEDYYEGCAAIATDLGEKMIGRRATGTGRDQEHAKANAEQKLLGELHESYMKATRLRCRICQDHYDDLTTHSLMPVSETEAIVQAKALEVAGKLPSTGMPVSSLLVTFGKTEGSN